ncbi:conjugal transfer protein [Streptomyces sp. NPDC054956]
MKNTLTGTQRAVLGLALVPMVAVGIAGGIGTYSNISAAYGEGTAIGALAAGEGATAVLAFLLLGLTLLGQSSPLIIRIGLWALPAVAAVIGATAATEGLGQTIVYAATPMAITAAAEGLAFLVRRIVVHQEGRDVEAETRAAAVIRDLAYHQARAAAHPDEKTRQKSVLRSWKLAAKVGTGDTVLGTQLLDVQRTRILGGADVALERMFQPAITAAPALLAAPATEAPAILPPSVGDVTTSGAHEPTIQAETSGYPLETGPDQGGESRSVRPPLSIVRTAKAKTQSMNADVKQMLADGVSDLTYVLDAVATRHNRNPEDPRFRQTVTRYWRDATATQTAQAVNEADRPGPYL